MWGAYGGLDHRNTDDFSVDHRNTDDFYVNHRHRQLFFLPNKDFRALRSKKHLANEWKNIFETREGLSVISSSLMRIPRLIKSLKVD